MPADPMDLEAQVARKVQRTMGTAKRSVQQVGEPTTLTRPTDKAKAQVRNTMGRAGKSIGDVGKATRAPRRNRGPF